MKMKKNTKGLAGCLVLAMVLPLMVTGLDVSAARKTKTISDSFDDVAVVDSYDSGTWSEYSGSGSTTKVEEVTAPAHVLEFKGTNINGESTVLMSNDWYWNVKSITFDVKIPDKENWFGIDFADIEKKSDYVGNYAEQGEPMCYGALRISKTGYLGITDSDWTYWGFSSAEIPDTWVSVKIVSDGAKTGKIYIAPKGRAFDESKAKVITLGEGRSFQNCNIVFVDYKFSGYKLDNVVINADNATKKDDFEENKCTLFSAVTYLTNTSVYSFPIVEDGAVRKLGFSDAKAGDRLIANVPIKQQDEHLKGSDEVMSASFSVDLNGNNSGAELVYVFGLADNTAEPFAASWGCVFNQNGGRIVRFESDGTETVLKKYTRKLSASKSGNAVMLSLNKDGILRVSINGSEVTKYKGITEYAGYVGFAAKTDLARTVYIDDVVISNAIYDVITTKTVSDDFSTNKLDAAGQTDFAYRAVTGSIAVKNGELAFEQCVDGSRYGSAYEYETFEMEFKLTSILGTKDPGQGMDATGPARWMGIDFGRQSVDERSYGSYALLYMRITPPEGVEEGSWKTSDPAIYKGAGSTLTGEELVVVNPIPSSYFTDITYDGKTKKREDISADAAVCFKVVATEDAVHLYMKRADQKNYKLYVTVNNVYPPGYATITCTAYSYFTIDDFEMKNTGTVYNEPEEVVVEAFENLSYEERGIGGDNSAWRLEQKLNAAPDTKLLVPILISGVSVVLIAGGIGFVLYHNRRKKKTNLEVGEENKDEKEN